MDLSILIKILLSDNETVIIPGFGAFISVYKPAVIRENDIIPPGKEIKFLPQIKNNDGLLAMHIARSKKISYDDAFKRIERASSKIIYQLDKGEKVAFGDLGELCYNEKGEIEFAKFETAERILPDGFEPVSLEDVKEIPEETKTEYFVEPESVVVEETEVKIEDVLVEQELPAEEETIHHEQKDEDIPVTEPAVIHQPVAEPAKRGRKMGIAWLLILLAVVAVVIIVFIFLAKNKQAANTNTESESLDLKIEVIQPETTASDTIQRADTSTAVVSKPQVQSLSPKFHLVGAGFMSEENADKYIMNLSEKGITGTRLGKQGNMHLVGIESFDTKQEAYNALNKRVKENPDWNLWVYKK